MIGNVPPPAATFEISLFGTGFGESVCVHLGEGEWMIVDSCVHDAEPIALKYLRSIGVDCSVAVKLIALSHWDADHIKGAAELYSVCEYAQLAYSQALTTAEFAQLIEGYAEPLLTSDANSNQLGEFRKIINVRRQRKQAGGPAPIAVSDGKILYRRGNVFVQALAPSARTIEHSIESLAAWLHSSPLDVARRPVAQRRNDFTLVLWVGAGSRCALLGGDLEIAADPDMGWQAAANSPFLHVTDRAGFFKVAHHGSPNGDHPHIWANLVDSDNPICALTAFNRGVTKRPAPADVMRLLGRTNLLYATTAPSARPAPRDRVVDKTMDERTRMRRVVQAVPGQVRIRWPHGGAPFIEVGGNAAPLA